MGREFRARTFKSGNSVALRLPKGLGLGEGDEYRIIQHADGSLSMWRTTDDKAQFMALHGSMSAGFAAEREDIDQDERDWSSGDRSHVA